MQANSGGPCDLIKMSKTYILTLELPILHNFLKDVKILAKN